MRLSTASVDVDDRGRRHGAAGLPAASGQELLPVAGVLADMKREKQQEPSEMSPDAL